MGRWKMTGGDSAVALQRLNLALTRGTDVQFFRLYANRLIQVSKIYGWG